MIAEGGVVSITCPIQEALAYCSGLRRLGSQLHVIARAAGWDRDVVRSA